MSKKEKEVKMRKEQIEKIEALAERIEKSMDELGIVQEDWTELFCETVALLILHWGRTQGWSPSETVSYAGYVIFAFMEKGIGAEIKNIEQYKSDQKLLHSLRGKKGN